MHYNLTQIKTINWSYKTHLKITVLTPSHNKSRNLGRSFCFRDWLGTSLPKAQLRLSQVDLSLTLESVVSSVSMLQFTLRAGMSSAEEELKGNRNFSSLDTKSKYTVAKKDKRKIKYTVANAWNSTIQGLFLWLKALFPFKIQISLNALLP